MAIKLLAFDLDGTLIELPEAHYQALNSAIEEIAGKEYIITRLEHNSSYNGISTNTKLKKLVKDKKLPEKHIQQINELKQVKTLEYIEQNITPNIKLCVDLLKLKQEGYLLYCASNAMLRTVEAGLKKLGVYNLFDYIVGNDTVKNQKPSPEIYLECFIRAGVDPSECLIVEDSFYGRVAAINSGAHLCEVNDPSQCTYEHISLAIDQIEEAQKPYIGFQGKNTLNVLVPLSGAGSRLRSLYNLPKPLIDIYGAPMIQRVVENLNVEANFIFIIQQEHDQNYNLSSYLRLISPGCQIVRSSGLTEGAASSTLLAKELINNDKQLLIANSDQIVAWNSSTFLHQALSSNADGSILTTLMPERNPKWSYAKVENGFVSEVAEKKPISDEGTIGIYWFKHGSDYVKAAEEMIAANDRTNNEFFCCPAYNYLIKDGKKIITHQINHLFGTGTPEDLEYFMTNFDNLQHLHHLKKYI